MAHNHAKTVGSRAEVWHGTAHHTSGGLTKKCLVKNKHGRIVSKKKHETAKKDRRLAKAGYGTKKGVFGYVKKNGTMSKKHKKSMKKRGKMGKKRGGTMAAHHVKTQALAHHSLNGGGLSHHLLAQGAAAQAAYGQNGGMNHAGAARYSRIEGMGGMGSILSGKESMYATR